MSQLGHQHPEGFDLTDYADMAEKTLCIVCGERLCRASTCQRCLASLREEREAPPYGEGHD